MRRRNLFTALLSLALLPCDALAYGLIGSSETQMAISAIQNAGRRARDVKAIKTVPSVGVVSLNVPHSNNCTDFSQYQVFAQRNAAGVSALRNALSANPATRQALERHGIPLGMIVGARISSKGSLRLYVLNPPAAN